MTCGCGCSGTTGCSCGSTSQCQPCGPSAGQPPYYICGSPIQELHCQSVVVQNFATAISTSSDFIMPSCLNPVVIKFPGLTQMQVGSYLWSSLVGYLRVTSFDFMAQEVVAVNDCIVGNATPGTMIPRCTLFNVVGSPYGAYLSISTISSYGNDLVTAPLFYTRIVFVTGADGVKGVKFPLSPVPGTEFIIHNTENGILNLYPGGAGDRINALALGAPITIAAYGSAMCHAQSTTGWWVGRMT